MDWTGTSCLRGLIGNRRRVAPGYGDMHGSAHIQVRRAPVSSGISGRIVRIWAMSYTHRRCTRFHCTLPTIRVTVLLDDLLFVP
jgi:hypothetical protein